VIPSRMFSTAAASILFVAAISLTATADVIRLGTLSTVYEPLAFTHDKHMEIGSECGVCHHHSNQETPRCGSCHGSTGGQGDKNIIGLKDAYHGRCVGCHEKMGGPAACVGCHKKKNAKLDNLTLNSISNMFKPVQFRHGGHIDSLSDCGLCHHHAEGGRAAACKSCHEAGAVYVYRGSERRTGLGLKGAYHVLCVGCHKKENAGPVGCAECHDRAQKSIVRLEK
jgi:hypothetical protein